MIKKLKIERLIFLTCLIICLITIVISGLEVKAMQAEIEELQYQNSRQAAQLLDKDYQIEILEAVIKNREQDASKIMDEPEYIGTFTVTHYCLENYPHICNDGESLYTASGQAPIPYYTIAADESIPFGTKLVIDGKEYEVMDRGGAITTGRLDIAVQTHDEALEKGIIETEIYLVN